ncbi:unnamed protein product, partial [Menidia menidia]
VVLEGQQPGTDFKEGLHPPLHGYVSCSSDGNNYGASCEQHCEGGYERRGAPSRVCQFNRSWSGAPAECVREYTATDKRREAEYPGTKPNPLWCHSPSLANGELTCRSPRGGAHRSTLGTRCETRCDRGYRLVGRRSIQCLSNRRWSGTAYCRKIRCHVLPLIPHGRYACSQGFVVDSRCDFTCRPGYRIQGEHSRTCLHGGLWSGEQPVCSDTDPPKIRCPPSRLKPAGPGKLTATFHEKRRLLILSAPNVSDPDYQLQNIMIQKSDCGLDLRHVTVIELLGSPPRETGRIKEKELHSEVINGLRQAFRISRSYFSMVLLDERGLDRERFITPVSSDELFSYIDGFLMDEEEREKLELRRDFCQ